MSKAKGRPEYQMKALYLIDNLEAWQLVEWTDVLKGEPIGDIEVYDVRVKATPEGDQPLLLVARGYAADGTPVVGFHAGNNVVDMMAAAIRRMRNGSFKWRSDEYANGRGAGRAD